MTIRTPERISATDSAVPNRQGAYQNYRIFDYALRSQVPLPELPFCGHSEPFVTTRRVVSSEADLAGFDPCHSWCSDSGQLTAQVSRRCEDYLLSFPGQAGFLLAQNGVISCVPEPEVEERRLRELLLSQVLPRYFAHTGELVLHASAVTLPNGCTVAFLGESGYGKSTLASFCHQQGAQYIDDDCILLRSGSGQAVILGGAPTVRLNSDSMDALGQDTTAFVPYADCSGKQQMRLADGLTPGAECRALDALFLLDAPQESGALHAVSIEPATGQRAVMAMISSAFNLDPSDHNTMSRTFESATGCLREGLSVYHLHYPREHALLPTVFQALLDHPGA